MDEIRAVLESVSTPPLRLDVGGLVHVLCLLKRGVPGEVSWVRNHRVNQACGSSTRQGAFIHWLLQARGAQDRAGEVR